MRIRLNLKIFIFILLFIITKQIKVYGILMLFTIIHELGHMLMGIILGFKPNKIEIMPLGLSIGFEGKVENYNRKIGKTSKLTIKKMIIAIAGPLTNLICILIFNKFSIPFFNIEKEVIIYSNIIIGLFNLIPIYPLDGGRILDGILNIIYGKRKTLAMINKISYISIILLTIISSILIIYLKNIAIILILAYLWYLVIIENKKMKIKERIYNTISENIV